MNWWRDLKTKPRLNELMKDHTTFRIGGPVEYFFEPKDADELKLLLIYAKRYNIPILVIGSGSNILANDKGINGIVLKLSSVFFRRISLHGNSLNLAAGVMLKQAIEFAYKRGLSGLEFLTGIPGTVGGALIMNAGVSKKIKNQKSKIKGIGDVVKNVMVMDRNGEIKTLHKKDIRFSYRKSSLSSYIVLNTSLILKKRSKEEIRNEIDRYSQYRRLAQDLSRPSAGCVFKNPKDKSAGRLIDLCGLKGKKVGGASISRIHANFILNDKNARAQDILRLMNLAKREVKNKFHIILKPEIKIW